MDLSGVTGMLGKFTNMRTIDAANLFLTKLQPVVASMAEKPADTSAADLNNCWSRRLDSPLFYSKVRDSILSIKNAGQYEVVSKWGVLGGVPICLLGLSKPTGETSQKAASSDWDMDVDDTSIEASFKKIIAKTPKHLKETWEGFDDELELAEEAKIEKVVDGLPFNKTVWMGEKLSLVLIADG